MQIPINDDLKKEDVELNLSDVKKENQIKIKPTDRVPNVKEFWINQTIANDLKIIFRHFKLEDQYINDLIFISVWYAGYPILERYKDLPEYKKEIEEEEYYKAYQKLIKSNVLKKYPNIFKRIKNIQDFKTIEKNYFENEKRRKRNLKGSRTPSNPTKFNFDGNTNHSTKVCWSYITAVIVGIGIEEERAKKIAVYILGYFQLIHRKHFENSITFNNFYKKSFYEKHQFLGANS